MAMTLLIHHMFVEMSMAIEHTRRTTLFNFL